MILVGSQRGGARDLAAHLMKEENEHIELQELRGFTSPTLAGALNEVYALSRGTQCTQFMFSLSINPPVSAQVSTASFLAAIDRAEKTLGLDGQPRAVVFHEKNGRRHAHAVWSRIRGDTLTAVHLPHTKKKLVALTRDMFIEHGWEMPAGLIDPARRDPRNFTLEEWQQARRSGKDPRAIKTALQDAWGTSDSPEALRHALAERGYILAKGDRSAFVAIDHKLKPYALPKWLGLKARDIRSRLGDGTGLPSVAEAEKQMTRDMAATLDRLGDDVAQRQAKAREELEKRRRALVRRQRMQRVALKARQDQRQQLESQLRQSRFRRGLGGVWDRLRGRNAQIRRRNELEAYVVARQDQSERDKLVWRHLAERRQMGIFELRLSSRYARARDALAHERQSRAHGAPRHFHPASPSIEL